MTDSDEKTAPIPLSKAPLWQYLLQDYLHLYRTGSAGGSGLIRAHMADASQLLGSVMDEDPLVYAGAGSLLPVCVHLDRALAGASNYNTAPFARSVGMVRRHLVWRYGYDDVPDALKLNFAFAEVLGPVGPIRSEKLKIGLVLFAPRTTYPTHSHEDICESYINISGHVSENDTGVSAPGSLIFNPPGQQHRITTADREPCLLSYVWTGASETLRTQKLKFSTVSV